MQYTDWYHIYVNNPACAGWQFCELEEKLMQHYIDEVRKQWHEDLWQLADSDLRPACLCQTEGDEVFAWLLAMAPHWDPALFYEIQPKYDDRFEAWPEVNRFCMLLRAMYSEL